MKVGQKNSHSRVWAQKNSRPRAFRQQQYLYTTLYGAVNVNTGNTEAIIIKHSDFQIMEKLLQQISNATKDDRIAVVLMDQAPWHRTQKIKIPENVRLLFIPPYSPELNPIEQVWAYLRRHFFSNRVFKSYEIIMREVEKAWNSLAKTPQKIIDIVKRSWMAI